MAEKKFTHICPVCQTDSEHILLDKENSKIIKCVFCERQVSLSREDILSFSQINKRVFVGSKKAKVLNIIRYESDLHYSKPIIIPKGNKK